MMSNIIKFDKIAPSPYSERRSECYTLGEIEKNILQIDCVIDYLNKIVQIPIEKKYTDKRYIAICSEIINMIRKAGSYFFAYEEIDFVMESIISFLEEVIKGNHELIESHYFSHYFNLYIEYNYMKKKYSSEKFSIEKIMNFSSLSGEEKKEYGIVVREIIADPLFSNICEKIL